VANKAVAIDKQQATRKVRGVMGKQQRKKVTVASAGKAAAAGTASAASSTTTATSAPTASKP
jgi:hypothetical protein